MVMVLYKNKGAISLSVGREQDQFNSLTVCGPCKQAMEFLATSRRVWATEFLESLLALCHNMSARLCP